MDGEYINENRITAFWNNLEDDYPRDYIYEDNPDTMGNLEDFNSLPKKPMDKNIHAKKDVFILNYNNSDSKIIKKSL